MMLLTNCRNMSILVNDEYKQNNKEKRKKKLPEVAVAICSNFLLQPKADSIKHRYLATKQSYVLSIFTTTSFFSYFLSVLTQIALSITISYPKISMIWKHCRLGNPQSSKPFSRSDFVYWTKIPSRNAMNHLT